MILPPLCFPVRVRFSCWNVVFFLPQCKASHVWPFLSTSDSSNILPSRPHVPRRSPSLHSTMDTTVQCSPDSRFTNINSLNVSLEQQSGCIRDVSFPTSSFSLHLSFFFLHPSTFLSLASSFTPDLLSWRPSGPFLKRISLQKQNNQPQQEFLYIL